MIVFFISGNCFPLLADPERGSVLQHGVGGDLRVPGAFGYGLLEVGPCESRAGHEVDVLLGVEAHLFEEGHQLLLTLLIPSGQE